MEKWTNCKGNVCFRFSMQKEPGKNWIIISVGISCVFVFGLEKYIFGTEFSLIPIAFLFFAVFLWWIDIPARHNEPIIKKTVHEIMDHVVDGDAKAAGVEVKKSIVYHEQKGTYGIVESSYLLVLLSNKVVWEYPIIYHGPANDEDAYFECDRNYLVSQNQTHIKKINPNRWKRFLRLFKLSDKSYLGALLIAILVIGGFSFIGFVWLLENFRWWFLLVILGYICVYSFTEWVYLKLPCSLVNVIRYMVSFPLAVTYLLFEIGQPFVTIIGTYFFVVLFAFGVPALLLIVLGKMEIIVLRPETIAFIVFSLGSILCSNYHSMTKWIIRHSPLQDWGNHTYESYRQGLAYYLIHPSNIVYTLYLVYFVFLTISGFIQIQDGGYLISENGDTAVIKAFLVFIAFTNMRSKQKDAQIDVKELLQKTLLLFVHDK